MSPNIKKISSNLGKSSSFYSLPHKEMFPKANLLQQHKETAIVYSEGFFGERAGEIANDLVRESNRFKIMAVIDSTKAGRDSGSCLHGNENGIPICSSLTQAIAIADWIPEYFIFGLEPDCKRLSLIERQLILKAMRLGMNVIVGLHEFLTEDPEFIKAAKKSHVKIIDVRKPKPKKLLHVFSNQIANVQCPRIVVMGTDFQIGKRTTAQALAKMLDKYGLNVVLIATGQIGLIQGTRYGAVLDAIPFEYCVGELETQIVKAYEQDRPDVIIIEGQGSLSHPSTSISAAIIKGAQPNAVILQHAPSRKHLTGFEQFMIPDLGAEIALIELFSGSPVIGITLNGEGMDAHTIEETISQYTEKFQRPVGEPFTESGDVLLEMVIDKFPELDLGGVLI
ncbi:DUF1611 domain-containing protein [Vibrio fluvialis]